MGIRPIARWASSLWLRVPESTSGSGHEYRTSPTTGTALMRQRSSILYTEEQTGNSARQIHFQ